MIKRGLDISLLDNVVKKLANLEPLDSNYQDHMLSGDFKDCHECHIKPDWLLIYYYDDDNRVLNLVDTGLTPIYFKVKAAKTAAFTLLKRKAPINDRG